MKTKSLLLIEPLEARIAPALTAATVSLGALTGNDGFTLSAFAALTPSSTPGSTYDTRVRGMVGMLMALDRFHEQ